MSGMIYAMMAAAMCFGSFFTLSRIPESLRSLVENPQLPGIAVIMILTLMYLILGCFIDGVALILITTPIFLPVVVGVGYEPIWFGLYMVVIIGMGGITPPVGVSCYVVSGTSGVNLQTVFKGSVPFIFAFIAMALLMALIPGIATWLPHLLM
jgi:TRAP-type C4-dicarboxylate transport system permease large subunit